MKKMSLKALRVNANLSQKEAAAKLGISNKTLCNWEKGASAPEQPQIDRICELYDVEYDNIKFFYTI